MFKCERENLKTIINSKEFQLLKWHIQFKFAKTALYCNLPKGGYADKFCILCISMADLGIRFKSCGGLRKKNDFCGLQKVLNARILSRPF